MGRDHPLCFRPGRFVFNAFARFMLHANIAELVRAGRLPVSLQAGAGWWLESPEGGPEGLRLRLQANFVLPKAML